MKPARCFASRAKRAHSATSSRHPKGVFAILFQLHSLCVNRLVACIPCPATSYSANTNAQTWFACSCSAMSDFAFVCAARFAILAHTTTRPDRLLALYALSALNSCCYFTQSQYSRSQPCEEGKFSLQPAALECLPCAAGSYSPTTGLAQCVACETGKFSNITTGATTWFAGVRALLLIVA